MVTMVRAVATIEHGIETLAAAHPWPIAQLTDARHGHRKTHSNVSCLAFARYKLSLTGFLEVQHIFNAAFHGQ